MELPDDYAAGGRYAATGWTQWPNNHDFSFNFARVLGAAQEGGSTVSECFLTAGRIIEGDEESWHREWTRIGDVNLNRAEQALVQDHVQTAKANWLRAANYYRTAEFLLDAADPRRLATFDKIEQCSHAYLAYLKPAGEIVCVPFEDSWLDAYFLRAPGTNGPGPVVICFGGLDEYKDELVHEMPKHAFPRGLSLLLVDLPGQGGSLRRRGLTLRTNTEEPVGACIDYLLSRPDVDPARIAVYGASLGGYFAPRAACFDRRIACVVSDGAVWNGLSEGERLRQGYAMSPGSIVWRHLKWVTGQTDIEGIVAHLEDARLEPYINDLHCPYLIVHGEADFGGIEMAKLSYAHLMAHDRQVTYKSFTVEETGACHCQIDNPSLGQEYICDWIADALRIDQNALQQEQANSCL